MGARMPRWITALLLPWASLLVSASGVMVTIQGHPEIGWAIFAIGIALAIADVAIRFKARRRRQRSAVPTDHELRRLLGLILNELYAFDCESPHRRRTTYDESERLAGLAFAEIARLRLEGPLAELRRAISAFQAALKVRHEKGKDVASGQLIQARGELESAAEDFLYADEQATTRSLAALPCSTDDLSTEAREILTGIDFPGQLDMRDPNDPTVISLRSSPSGRTFGEPEDFMGTTGLVQDLPEPRYYAALAELRSRGLVVGYGYAPHGLTKRGEAVRKRL